MSASKRVLDWADFSSEVATHIEDYTVPQYGDKGEDIVTNWTAEDCLRQVDKYLKRRGRNARPDQDRLDLIKAVHFIQMAVEKIDTSH
jgi:hypothetical protein